MRVRAVDPDGKPLPFAIVVEDYEFPEISDVDEQLWQRVWFTLAQAYIRRARPSHDGSVSFPVFLPDGYLLMIQLEAGEESSVPFRVEPGGDAVLSFDLER